MNSLHALSKFKTFPELATACQISEKKLWRIMIGKAPVTIAETRLIAKITGISMKALVMSEDKQRRFRPHFLEWISDRSGVSKVEVWRTFNQKTAMRKKKAKALAKWSGIPQEDWRDGSAWMIVDFQQQNME